MTIKRALISVSDKTGIVEFAQNLVALGVEILSTGGTYKLLKDNNIGLAEISMASRVERGAEWLMSTTSPTLFISLIT